MDPLELRELLAAAERARAGWDKSAAPGLYSEAIELVGDDESRGRFRLLRGLALIDAGDLRVGAEELGDLLPGLDGRDEVEALLGIGRASMWMEQTERARSMAERSLARAEELGDQEMRAPSLALLSQSTGNAGGAGRPRCGG